MLDFAEIPRFVYYFIADWCIFKWEYAYIHHEFIWWFDEVVLYVYKPYWDITSLHDHKKHYHLVGQIGGASTRIIGIKSKDLQRRSVWPYVDRPGCCMAHDSTYLRLNGCTCSIAFTRIFIKTYIHIYTIHTIQYTIHIATVYAYVRTEGRRPP